MLGILRGHTVAIGVGFEERGKPQVFQFGVELLENEVQSFCHRTECQYSRARRTDYGTWWQSCGVVWLEGGGLTGMVGDTMAFGEGW